MVSTGFRNPIALRCAKGTGACFGLELARDFAPQQGSREKLFPVQLGADYGQPCCATQDQPYTDSPTGTDCSGIASEITSFLIDHTPFGLDFEQGALNVNVVFRWEYMLGSTLFLVYTRAQVPATTLGLMQVGDLDLGAVKRAPAADAILLKLT